MDVLTAWHLLNSNSFVTSAALVGVCTLQSAVLIYTVTVNVASVQHLFKHRLSDVHAIGQLHSTMAWFRVFCTVNSRY